MTDKRMVILSLNSVVSLATYRELS